MTKTKLLFPIVAAAAFLLPQTVSAQEMLSPTVGNVQALAAMRGPAEIVPPSPDYFDPYIDAEANGYYYLLIMIGCENMINCEQIELSASFTGTEPDLDFVNSWNAGNRFGTAYVEEGSVDEVLLSYSFLIDPAISRANFDQMLSFWFDIMDDFSNQLYGPPAGSK